MAATSGKKNIVDVSKPGKTPADATARPIITGHAIMKDPMVNETKPEDATAKVSEEAAVKDAVAPSAAHKVIQPLASEDNPEDKKTDKPEEPQTKDEAPADDNVSDEAVVDAVLGQVGDKKKEDKQSEEDRKRQEAVDKLVTEKKYFLPIAHENATRNNRIILIILGALVPVLVGLLLAIDAGIIKTNLSLPFDLIKNEQSNQQTATQSVPEATPVSTTKTLVNKNFGVSIQYPTNWQATDNSLKRAEGPPSLDWIFKDGNNEYNLFTVTGKGGDCTPRKTDKAHATDNLCPTYEEIGHDKAANGTLIRVKFTDKGKTSYNLCFRPATAALDLTYELNKAVMGFVLECGPDDIFIKYTKGPDASLATVYDQPSVVELQKALKTISYITPKPTE